MSHIPEWKEGILILFLWLRLTTKKRYMLEREVCVLSLRHRIVWLITVSLSECYRRAATVMNSGFRPHVRAMDARIAMTQIPIRGDTTLELEGWIEWSNKRWIREWIGNDFPSWAIFSSQLFCFVVTRHFWVHLSIWTGFFLDKHK